MDSARRTLEVISQNSTRTNNHKLSRNYGTNDRMLRYKRINQWFFMDTFFATRKAGKSSRGNTCCQLFVTNKGFVYIAPMKNRSEVLQAVKQFTKKIGAPEAIISDKSGEQASADLKKILGDIGITLRLLEENTPWSNKAELYIDILKEAVRKDMKDSNCPLASWDYCIERRARVHNMTSKDTFKLRGTNPHTDLTGDEGDISNLCQYLWYEWCYFRDQGESFPFQREVLGRILGSARGEGNEMAQWILKSNGKVVPRRSHRPLKTEEIYSANEKDKRRLFDQLIQRRWGDGTSGPNEDRDNDNDDENNFEEYEDENEPARAIPDIEDMVDATGMKLNQAPAYDLLLNSEVALQLDDRGVTTGVLKRRAVGPDGNIYQGSMTTTPT